MTQRYDRQMRYEPFGKYGQAQLQQTHVMIMGAGALGSQCAELLTRMGVGQLTIIDMDIVEESNLHRQATYVEADATQMLPKVEALKVHLGQINSEVQVQALYQEITNTNIEALLCQHQPDIVLDGMDHFAIRYLINEVCHKLGVPWIYGAAVGSKGTVYAIDYHGPCLKCMLGTTPSTGESCAINGVLPPVIHQVASMEVSELLRWLSGKGFSRKLTTMDCYTMQYKTLNIDTLKNNNCPICNEGNYEYLNMTQQNSIEKQCGNVFLLRFTPQIFKYTDLLPVKVMKSNYFAKMISYRDYEITLFKDGRMNVYGIENEDQAVALYEEFLKCLK